LGNGPEFHPSPALPKRFPPSHPKEASFSQQPLPPIRPGHGFLGGRPSNSLRQEGLRRPGHFPTGGDGRYKPFLVRGGLRASKGLLVGLVLIAGAPHAALAADGGTGASEPGVDLGLQEHASRTPAGDWQWDVAGAALLPFVDVASHFRLGLRLTDTGRVEQLSARGALGPVDLTEAQALFWNGRMDRGPNNQVAISFAGGVRLDALAGRLGIPQTPWVELGLQTRAMGVDTVGRTRMSTTVVLSLDFDVLAAGTDARTGRTSSGLRIRASAALGNDPGCTLGTPALLFSGHCLSLALALEF
jgi:hypothetical protein